MFDAGTGLGVFLSGGIGGNIDNPKKYVLISETFSFQEAQMRKSQMVLLVGSALVFCLAGCSASLSPADQNLLKQAIDASNAASRSAQASEASAARAEKAAAASDASAAKAADAANRAVAAASSAEQSAKKAEKAFEMGLRK